MFNRRSTNHLRHVLFFSRVSHVSGRVWKDCVFPGPGGLGPYTVDWYHRVKTEGFSCRFVVVRKSLEGLSGGTVTENPNKTS